MSIVSGMKKEKNAGKIGIPEKKTTFVVTHGSLDHEGEHRRFFDALAIMKIIQIMRPDDVSIHIGEHCAMIQMPDGLGDYENAWENAVSYVDIQKADVFSELEPIAEKVKVKAEENHVPSSAFGVSLLKTRLDMMYMKYDMWD